MRDGEYKKIPLQISKQLPSPTWTPPDMTSVAEEANTYIYKIKL